PPPRSAAVPPSRCTSSCPTSTGWRNARWPPARNSSSRPRTCSTGTAPPSSRIPTATCGSSSPTSRTSPRRNCAAGSPRPGERAGQRPTSRGGRGTPPDGRPAASVRGPPRLQLPVVDGDRERCAPEGLVQRPGGSVERVASRADLHHLGPGGAQGREGVLAQGGADVGAAVERGHGEQRDAAVPALRDDAPRHVAREAVAGVGDGDMGVPLGCVEAGELAAVVLAPVAVLVGEDGLAHQGAEGVLVERTEGVDGE